MADGPSAAVDGRIPGGRARSRFSSPRPPARPTRASGHDLIPNHFSGLLEMALPFAIISGFVVFHRAMRRGRFSTVGRDAHLRRRGICSRDAGRHRRLAVETGRRFDAGVGGRRRPRRCRDMFTGRKRYIADAGGRNRLRPHFRHGIARNADRQTWPGNSDPTGESRSRSSGTHSAS